MITRLQRLMQFYNIRMTYILNYHHLFSYHLSLLLTHRPNFYHLDSVTLYFSLFAPLEDFTCRPRSYFSYEFIVSHFFQKLSHIIIV